MNFGLVNASQSLPEWQAVADETEKSLGRGEILSTRKNKWLR